ncbi:hypothetical protein F5Y18DRAFT_14715 [Xylariaceae sp. FL1019]|nr:hypothetical protein F5Y18DRAFT_14715 [Xylariaceae sp. FL1019]
MANDKIPSVGSLDRPENVHTLLKGDRGDDCLECRLTGGAAFLGLAGYSYYSGNKQIDAQRAKIIASKSPFGIQSRKFGIAATSLALAYLGIWRAFL